MLTTVPHAVAAPAAPGVWLALSLRRTATAAVALALLGTAGHTTRPAYAYNCVNVLLRDSYWGQYRRIVESGWNAAGVGTAFGRNGFVVDNTPAAGSIMVWPAGYLGASGTGHVAIVALIYDDSRVLVRHENWPYGMAEHAQVFAVRPGHQFVHQMATSPLRSTQTPGTAPDEEGDQEGEDMHR